MMSDNLMELNDTELNYIYFETDSDDDSNKSDGNRYFKQVFCTGKHFVHFQMWSIFFVAETFALN